MTMPQSLQNQRIEAETKWPSISRHFKCVLNEYIYIYIYIYISRFWSHRKFVPKGPIDNIPTLVQKMVWRPPGDKPLSETMMVSLLTHICFTRPQCYWVCRITASLSSTKINRKYHFIFAQIHSVSQGFKESVILHNRGNRQCIRFALTMHVNKFVSLKFDSAQDRFIIMPFPFGEILLDMWVS